MAKKRTKKQKMKAAERRSISISEHGYSFNAPTVSTTKVKTIAAQTPARHSEKDHSYVFSETRQTILVVTGIIVGQLVLAALIRTNIINLPF